MLSEEQRKELRQIFLEEIEKLYRSVAGLQDRARPEQVLQALRLDETGPGSSGKSSPASASQALR